MKPRRVLLVVTLSERGGAQRHVADLARGLIDRSYEVHLACAAGGPLVEEVQAFGARIHIQPHLKREISFIQDVRELVQLVKLIRAVGPDLVHAHSSKAGFLARCAARLCRVPSLYTAHGLVFLEPLGRLRRAGYLAMERLGGIAGSAVIAVSERDADAARRYKLARGDGIVTIPNGYTPGRSVQEPPPTPPFRFGVIANAYPTKGLDVLLRAARGEVLRDLDFEVVVAGDGPDLPWLIRAAVSLPVTFSGFVDDVGSFLDRCHAVVQPSYKEGWPYSVLEAMAAARPVIATDVGGVPNQIDGEECGWIVAPGDPDGLARAMAAAVTSPREAARRGRAGRARLESQFSLSKMLDSVEETYARIAPTDNKRRTA